MRKGPGAKSISSPSPVPSAVFILLPLPPFHPSLLLPFSGPLMPHFSSSSYGSQKGEEQEETVFPPPPLLLLGSRIPRGAISGQFCPDCASEGETPPIPLLLRQDSGSGKAYSRGEKGGRSISASHLSLSFPSCLPFSRG